MYLAQHYYLNFLRCTLLRRAQKNFWILTHKAAMLSYCIDFARIDNCFFLNSEIPESFTDSTAAENEQQSMT